MLLKFCGLRRQEDVTLAARLGATHCGFVFHAGSPRCVDAVTVSRLESGDMVRVGVFTGQDSDEQLAAQAMCLEEMLCCTISYGYIFYGEIRHRMKVEFTDEIRDKVRRVFEEMHKYYEQRYTPKVKTGTRCNACSLKDICLPILNKKKSVSGYIDRMLSEEENI